MLLGLLTQLTFQDLDEIAELHWVVIADVVDAVGSRTAAAGRLFAAPIPIGLGNPFHYPNHAFRHIVYVGEISPHSAIVIHVNRLALENGSRELEKRHVGTPPRSIDGKKAKTGTRQAVNVRVGVSH